MTAAAINTAAPTRRSLTCAPRTRSIRRHALESLTPPSIASAGPTVRNEPNTTTRSPGCASACGRPATRDDVGRDRLDVRADGLHTRGKRVRRQRTAAVQSDDHPRVEANLAVPSRCPRCPCRRARRTPRSCGRCRRAPRAARPACAPPPGCERHRESIRSGAGGLSHDLKAARQRHRLQTALDRGSRYAAGATPALRAPRAPPRRCRIGFRRAAPARAGRAARRLRPRQRPAIARARSQSKSRPSCCRSAPTAGRARRSTPACRAHRRWPDGRRERCPAFSRPMVSTVAAEPVAVVEIDRRDQRDVGVDDVDRVEPPAHARPRARSHRAARRRRPASAASALNSKNVSVSVAARRVDALERRDQRLVGNFDAADGDALVIAKQMRRGERADAIAGLARGCAPSARRMEPLPLVPATVIDRAGRTPPVQPIERALQAVQPEIDGVGMQRLLPREPIGETAEPRGSARWAATMHQPAGTAGLCMNIVSSPAMRSRMSRRSTIMSSAP